MGFISVKSLTNLSSNLIEMSFTAVGYLLMHRNNAPETSSSSSDEEWNATLQNYNREKRKLRPRIIDYENIIIRYSDEEFKSHFR